MTPAGAAWPIAGAARNRADGWSGLFGCLVRDDGQGVAAAAMQREAWAALAAPGCGPQGGFVAQAAGDLVTPLLEEARVEVHGDDAWCIRALGVGEYEAKDSHGDLQMDSAMGAM